MNLNKNLILKEFVKLIIGSLGMISALAWNEAFTNLFKQYPVIKKNGPWIYAIIITIITLLMVFIFASYNLFDQSLATPGIATSSSINNNSSNEKK